MFRVFTALILLVVTPLLVGEYQVAEQKDRLSQLQPLVGKWRGVGQPVRGSTKGSWIEEADWAWSFEEEKTALVSTQPMGKYFSQLRLTAGTEGTQYILGGTPADGGVAVKYIGKLDDQQQLVLDAEEPRVDLPRRLSFRFAGGGDRLLLLMEKKAPGGDQFMKIAEIGYTRQGSGFGKNATQRECIVTGGLGTIEVSHDGKTYYVCCTGCRDYFNENPKEVLAEYGRKKVAEKAK